jgi:hypothetical protein
MTRPLFALMLMACGSSAAAGDFDTLGDDPGDGTGTLLVEGSASAEPAIGNSTDPSNFTTRFEVRVARDGIDVSDGVVEVRSTFGAVALLFDTVTKRWRGGQPGYFETYQLAVTTEMGTVEGVRVDGPDIHAFTAPSPGATVDSRLPLDITWTRNDTAEAAALRTRDIDVAIGDNGMYALAANSLRSKPDQTEDERLEVTRTQRITPAGGVVGSSWRVSIRNQLELVVLPTR